MIPTFTPAQVLAATRIELAEMRKLTNDTAVIQRWLARRVRARLLAGVA